MMKTFERKLQGEVQVASEDGFPTMSSRHYLNRLQDLHLRLQPKTYFEIGTESGSSLWFSKCASIAVDPQFRLEGDMVGGKPELHLFQTTSDDFFSKGHLDRIGRTIDFAFLDGLHLFEVLLRDFIGTERHMSPNGLIAVHDCVPINAVMAERRWRRRVTNQWTGDVWKLIPILREYRPDLQVAVRDYAPTGLVEITNLDPSNSILQDRYQEIVDRFMGLQLEGDTLRGWMADLDICRSDAPPARVEPKRVIAIKTGMPSADVAEKWGDYHFAKGLIAAFRRQGIDARMDIMPDWAGRSGDSLDLVIQGHDHYPAGPERPTFLWYIYPGKRFPLDALSGYAHVFAASSICADRLREASPGARVTMLEQGFDADRMRPQEPPPGARPVFVGNNHFRELRQIVSLAVDAGTDIDIWGEGWDKTPAAGFVRGASVDNRDVAATYGTAAAVLSDQTAAMSRNGIISNRIYDALACACPVISTPMPGLPQKMLPFVKMVETPEEFAAALADVSAEGDDMKALRRNFAKEMRETDSFDARAAVILETATELELI